MSLALKKSALFSQYNRVAETPVFVSQYSVMLSRRSSRVRALSRVPCRTGATSPGGADRVPAGGGRLGGEPVARQRGNDQIERVRRGRAVRGGVGQRVDDLQLLDDRAGPAVRDDQRQRVRVRGADVEEMD